MNWKLLHRYLSDECDPEEVQQVESWLQVDDRNKKFMRSLRKIWSVEPGDEMDVNAKIAWQNFKNKLDKEQEETATLTHKIKTKTTFSSKRFERSVAISLTAAAILLLAVLFYNFMPHFSTQEKYAIEKETVQKVETKRGQRTTVRLLDGTRVQLNADSRIQVSPEFGDTNRTVYLEGEAYFEVAHDPSKPFIVYSGKAYTKVLGTKFGVRSYSDEGEIQVVVAEGKVELGSNEQNTPESRKKITPYHIGRFSESGTAKISKVENIDQYLGWRNGQLIFQDTPLSNVSTQLERWFDIKIILEDSSLSDRRLKASFENEPMTEVLNVISLSLDIKYKRDGRVVRFKK